MSARGEVISSQLEVQRSKFAKELDRLPQPREGAFTRTHIESDILPRLERMMDFTHLNAEILATAVWILERHTDPTMWLSEGRMTLGIALALFNAATPELLAHKRLQGERAQAYILDVLRVLYLIVNSETLLSVNWWKRFSTQ